MTDTRQSIRDHNKKTILGRVVIATTLAALVFLTGCDGAGTPMEQEQPPQPTLIGTWQIVHTSTYDDGEMETTTTTLTFTNSRFIEFNLREEESGTTYSYWANSGTYTRTDTTVTKIYHNWIDELEAYNDETIEVIKDYLWGDAERSTLLVHDWGDDDAATYFERYTRIDGPDPSEIVGTWVYGERWEDGSVEQTVTYTITTDGTFTETDHRVHVESGDIELFTLSGNLTIDEDNQILKVAVTSASEEWNDEPQEGFSESEFVGQELRYGYTRGGAGQPDRLSFSPRWAEQEWNDETMMYEENKDHPYGHYWWVFTRQ